MFYYFCFCSVLQLPDVLQVIEWMFFSYTQPERVYMKRCLFVERTENDILKVQRYKRSTESLNMQTHL